MMQHMVNKPGAGSKTIGQLSTEYGVSLRALRFYEDRGMLTPTRIGSQRFYSARDEVRLRIILVGKRLGFSLLEIDRLMLAHVDQGLGVEHRRPEQVATAMLAPTVILEKIRDFERKRDETDRAIAELRARALEAREPAVA